MTILGDRGWGGTQTVGKLTGNWELRKAESRAHFQMFLIKTASRELGLNLMYGLRNTGPHPQPRELTSSLSQIKDKHERKII